MELTYKGVRGTIDYGLYQDLYSGYSSDIHDYKHLKSNGGSCTKCLDTLNMPKIIGEDYASLIIGEELKITTGIDNLDPMLEDKFIPDMSIFLERMLIVGQAIIIPYIYESKLKYKFYYGNEFEVKEWFDARPKVISIKEVDYDTLIEVEYIDDTITTHITYHKNDSTPKGFEMPSNYDLDGALNYFKPNITNNISNDNQGLSVLANAIDILRTIDKTYTDLNKEYDLSRKRMFLSTEMLQTEEVTKDGKVETFKHFDEDECLYQLINSTDSKDYIQAFDSAIRVNEYEQGIKLNLKLLSSSVGLSEYYDFDKGLVSRATATQVISDNSKLFRNKKKQEQLLEKELSSLINMFAFLLEETIEELIIEFDDAIIIDDDKELEKGLKLYDAGVLSLDKLMTDYMGYTETETKEEMNRLGDVEDFIDSTSEDTDQDEM